MRAQTCLCWIHCSKPLKVNDDLLELFSGEVKELSSALEVQGLKDTLSNVDILISPCDPDIKTCSVSPQGDPAEGDKGRLTERSPLEAAMSFPLVRSKVTQCLSSPTLSRSPSSNKISSIIHSPAQQDQTWATGLTSEESKGKADETELPGHEQEGPNDNAEEEELLVGEDQMYPTLRSKSLNTNPRKMRKKKEDEEMPRSASSVKDLVSAFSGGP